MGNALPSVGHLPAECKPFPGNSANFCLPNALGNLLYFISRYTVFVYTCKSKEKMSKPEFS